MFRHALHITVAAVTCLVGASVVGALNFVGRVLTPEPPATVIRQEPAHECQTSPPAPSLTAEQEAAKWEILEIYRRYDIAQANHDAAFFERVEADGWILTRDEGETLTRSQAIADMKTWPEGIEFTTEDIRVQFYGDAAVVTSRRTETYPDGGPQYVGSWLDVFQKREGRWQIISTTLVD